jgi:hypothetical protein
MKYFFLSVERPEKKNFRYPMGNNLAEGPALAGFKQSRFSRDCLKKISLRSLRLCGE